MIYYDLQFIRAKTSVIKHYNDTGMLLNVYINNKRALCPSLINTTDTQLAQRESINKERNLR